ncbi:MAG: hypothetical protein GX235_04830 [Clostridiales bacterium]|nr:hypothetical protein [Clostridiales bacterium]
MAGRKPKKSIEERISEKEELISALQIRIKSEQDELENLYNEKKLKDLESISELISTSGLSPKEVTEALEAYSKLKEHNAS